MPAYIYNKASLSLREESWLVSSFFFPFRKAGTSATFPTPVKVPCSLSRVVNMDDRTYLNEKNESMDLVSSSGSFKLSVMKCFPLQKHE